MHFADGENEELVKLYAQENRITKKLVTVELHVFWDDLFCKIKEEFCEQ